MTSASVRSPNCDLDGEHDGVWGRDEIGEEFGVGDLFESEEGDDSSEEFGSSGEYENGALYYYDVAYNLGCHKSFPDYHGLYVTER